MEMLLVGASLYAFLYCVIRLAVQHGIDHSKLGSVLLKNEELKLQVKMDREKAKRSEEELRKQAERIEKLDLRL